MLSFAHFKTDGTKLLLLEVLAFFIILRQGMSTSMETTFSCKPQHMLYLGDFTYGKFATGIHKVRNICYHWKEFKTGNHILNWKT